MLKQVVEPRSDAVWTWQRQGVSVVFGGRGVEGSRAEAFERITGEARPVAWARQIHSARVLAARVGECGEGDALVGRENGLALSVVTADCVPVLLSGPAGIAAAHAGWRGIAAGVVGATVAALGGPPEECAAWIGPAIGPCCYETGQDVADQVVAASHPAISRIGSAGRPHLDLQAAVRHQLQVAGILEIQAVPLCTRCEETKLHSYRRDGKRAGRNHAFIWRGC
jgi:purine-nucleoside/S-methyl-5'-thioadenosine phosphorylase / adenosine deaminase